MKRLEWFIARRYLASRHKGRFLSLITIIAIGGIFLGVMALITVIAVMTGLQKDLQSKIIGTNPHIYVFQSGGQVFRLANPYDVIDTLKSFPGITTMRPFIMTQVVVVTPGQSARSATLYGLPKNRGEPALNDVERMVLSGEKKLTTTTGRPGILLGERLATNLGTGRGDVLRIASFENIRTDPLGNLDPKIVEFEVTDVFKTGMYEYDTQFMYAELDPVREVLSLDTTMVSGIAVNVEDPWNVEAVRAQIDGKLGFGYYTEDWMRLNEQLFSALKLEKLAMAVILFLIVLVAAFNIISTLIMVVADKTREIGILKSMGLTDAKVQRIFMLQGLTIGVIGTLLGTIGGLILVWVLDTYQLVKLDGNVYFIDTLPVALDPLDLLSIVAASLLIAFTATIYPARQASRLLPVEAIRHD